MLQGHAYDPGRFWHVDKYGQSVNEHSSISTQPVFSSFTLYPGSQFFKRSEIHDRSDTKPFESMIGFTVRNQIKIHFDKKHI